MSDHYLSTMVLNADFADHPLIVADKRQGKTISENQSNQRYTCTCAQVQVSAFVQIT
jgi:hypothetical protein